MASLADFIASLSDRQFAFFVRYRAKEFLIESKEIIANEFIRRSMSMESVEALTKRSKVVINENCPRCQSHDFFLEYDIQLIMSRYSSSEVKIWSKRCRICGYNAHRDKPLNFRVRLQRWLGRYSWREEMKNLV